MKFAMSYSCGKDSTFALHHMLAQGHEPVALIVMVNAEERRAYFHGVDYPMLENYSAALGIPLLAVPTRGEAYAQAMEAALRRAAALGAAAACFGDIDIENNRAWSEARCKAVGIQAVFPLWKQGRRKNVQDLVEAGYQCLIKSVNTALLPRSLLGRIIDHRTIAEMEGYGIDVCGENGEYHTLVVDGPIFKQPIRYSVGEILDFGEYSSVEVISGWKPHAERQ